MGSVKGVIFELDGILLNSGTDPTRTAEYACIQK